MYIAGVFLVSMAFLLFVCKILLCMNIYKDCKLRGADTSPFMIGAFFSDVTILSILYYITYVQKNKKDKTFLIIAIFNLICFITTYILELLMVLFSFLSNNFDDEIVDTINMANSSLLVTFIFIFIMSISIIIYIISQIATFYIYKHSNNIILYLFSIFFSSPASLIYIIYFAMKKRKNKDISFEKLPKPIIINGIILVLLILLVPLLFFSLITII